MNGQIFIRHPPTHAKITMPCFVFRQRPNPFSRCLMRSEFRNSCIPMNTTRKYASKLISNRIPKIHAMLFFSVLLYLAQKYLQFVIGIRNQRIRKCFLRQISNRLYYSNRIRRFTSLTIVAACPLTPLTRTGNIRKYETILVVIARRHYSLSFQFPPI